MEHDGEDDELLTKAKNHHEKHLANENKTNGVANKLQMEHKLSKLIEEIEKENPKMNISEFSKKLKSNGN